MVTSLFDIFVLFILIYQRLIRNGRVDINGWSEMAELIYLFQHALNATQDFRIYVGYPGLVYSPCHVNLTFQLYQLLHILCSTHLQLKFLGFCFNIQQNWWYWLQLFLYTVCHPNLYAIYQPQSPWLLYATEVSLDQDNINQAAR